MNDALKKGISDRETIANMNARETLNRANSESNIIETAFNGASKFAQTAISTYSQSKLRADAPEIEKGLQQIADQYTNVDDPNAYQNYLNARKNYLDEYLQDKNIFYKGMFNNNWRADIEDKAYNNFDSQMINALGNANLANANDIMIKSRDAASKHEDLSIYTNPLIYKTVVGDNGIEVVQEEVKLDDLWDTNTGDEQKDYFNTLINAQYIAASMTMTKDKARAWVNQQIPSIESDVIKGEIFSTGEDWAMNGELQADGTRKYYTESELIKKMQSWYDTKKPSPYTGRPFSAEESQSYKSIVETVVSGIYDGIRADSDEIILHQMSDYWKQTEADSYILPENTYVELANRGLIVYDETTGRVIDHSKINDKTWSSIEQDVEFNKHLYNAEKFAQNPVDMTGDNIVDLVDMKEIDRDAVKFLSYDVKAGKWYVDEHYAFRQFTTSEYKLADSTVDYLTRKITTGEAETIDANNENRRLGALIYGYDIDDAGNVTKNTSGAVDLYRANAFADAEDYSLIDEQIKNKKDAEGNPVYPDYDLLSANEKKILRVGQYAENESKYDRIIGEAFNFIDENGEKFAGNKTEGIKRLESMFAGTKEGLVQNLDARIRAEEDTLEKCLYTLDVLAMMPSIDYAMDNSIVSNEVLDTTYQYLYDYMIDNGLDVEMVSRSDVTYLQAQCKTYGLDYTVARKVFNINRMVTAIQSKGLTNGSSASEFVKDILSDDILPMVKDELIDNYEVNVSKLTSSKAWEGRGSEYDAPKKAKDIDKSVSDNLNYEIYTHNSYDYMKRKESTTGRLQYYIDAVASGEIDLATAQRFALSDPQLSVKDTEVFRSKGFAAFAGLYADNPTVESTVKELIKDFSGTCSEAIVFNAVMTGLLDAEDMTSDQLASRFVHIRSDLARESGGQVSKGLMEYRTENGSTYDITLVDKKGNLSSDWTALVSQLKVERKNMTSDTVSAVNETINTYQNSPDMGFDGYRAMFFSLDNSDEKTKNNILISAAFEAMTGQSLTDDYGFDVKSDTFEEDATQAMRTLGWKDADLLFCAGCCAELSNRAEAYTTAKAGSFGVPVSPGGGLTDKGYDMSNGYFIAKDGRSSIDSSFMGEEVDGEYNYRPIRDEIAEQTKELLENDKFYLMMCRTIDIGGGITEGEEELYGIRSTYNEKNKTLDNYSGSATRAELDAFFEKYPDSPYKSIYENSSSLDDFWIEMAMYRETNYSEGQGKDILIEYINRVAQTTDATQKYFTNKKELESANYTSMPGSWVLPDVVRIETDGAGGIIGAYLIDTSKETVVAEKPVAKTQDEVISFLSDADETSNITVRLPSEDGYNEYQISAVNLQDLFLRGKKYITINGKRYTKSELRDKIVISE